MIASANNSLSLAFSSGTNGQTQSLISGIKLLKDSLVMIVRITAHLMDGMEFFKSEKDCRDVLYRITAAFSSIMMQV